MSDTRDPRKAILARRARFVAAALAAALPVAGCDKKAPKPDDDTVQPQACLKIAVEPGGDGKHGKTADAGVPDAETDAK